MAYTGCLLSKGYLDTMNTPVCTSGRPTNEPYILGKINWFPREERCKMVGKYSPVYKCGPTPSIEGLSYFQRQQSSGIPGSHKFEFSSQFSHLVFYECLLLRGLLRTSNHAHSLQNAKSSLQKDFANSV